MISSSSDSDAVERVRNIRNQLVRLSARDREQDSNDEHAYKKRFGDLIFNAYFETGNLGFVEQVDEFEYDLMVRPDVANPRHRLWFNFTVSNQRPNQCVIFTFVNLSCNESSRRHLKPVVRSRQHPNWTHLHQDQVFYYRSPNHGKRLVLSVAFRFLSYDNEHQFALHYPYGHSTLSSFINRWSVELARRHERRRRHRRRRRLPQDPKGRLCHRSVSPRSRPGSRSESCQSRPILVGGTPTNRTPPTGRPPQSDNRLSSLSRASSRSSPLPSDVDILRSVSRRVLVASPVPRPASTSLAKANGAGHDEDRRSRTMAEEDEARFEVRTIESSILNKSIHLLEIGDRSRRPTKPLVFVVSRFGGNLDSAASLICQGMVDFALSDNPLAEAARHCMELRVFPMIDPDSICAGNSRSHILGQTSLALVPNEIEAAPQVYGNFVRVRDEIRATCAAAAELGCRRVVMLDLRINPALVGARMVGTYYEDIARMERHLALPRLMVRFAGDFYLEFCEFNHCPTVASSACNRAKPSTAQCKQLALFDLSKFENNINVDRYLFEASPLGAYKRSLQERSYEDYDQPAYLALGKATVLALLELLRPKDQRVAPCVRAVLDAFHPSGNDIDKLSLKHTSETFT